MQYRHNFHAGNFADVHKHIVLLQLIEALRRKAKGFLYLETHAGDGLYDLNGPEARHGTESGTGFRQLEQQLARTARRAHPAIQNYLDAVERIRGIHGRQFLPGSPLLAAAALRESDQAVCVEVQAQAARALQRVFERSASLLATTPRVVTGDGYQEVKRALPPPSRRGITLLDPPYEAPDEERQVAAALAAGLARFETGVFAVWYPIKKQHDSDMMLARVVRGIERPTLAAELCLTTPDHAAGLNGSGMLVVNPPWRFDKDAGAWQAELLALLGGDAGSKVRWLVHEE